MSSSLASAYEMHTCSKQPSSVTTKNVWKLFFVFVDKITLMRTYCNQNQAIKMWLNMKGLHFIFMEWHLQQVLVLDWKPHFMCTSMPKNVGECGLCWDASVRTPGLLLSQDVSSLQGDGKRAEPYPRSPETARAFLAHVGFLPSGMLLCQRDWGVLNLLASGVLADCWPVLFWFCLLFSFPLPSTHAYAVTPFLSHCVRAVLVKELSLRMTRRWSPGEVTVSFTRQLILLTSVCFCYRGSGAALALGKYSVAWALKFPCIGSKSLGPSVSTKQMILTTKKMHLGLSHQGRWWLFMLQVLSLPRAESVSPEL